VSGAGPTVLALLVAPLPESLRELATEAGFAALDLPLAEGVQVR
jgi:hypothetical protein